MSIKCTCFSGKPFKGLKSAVKAHDELISKFKTIETNMNISCFTSIDKIETCRANILTKLGK